MKTVENLFRLAKCKLVWLKCQAVDRVLKTLPTSAQALATSQKACVNAWYELEYAKELVAMGPPIVWRGSWSPGDTRPLVFQTAGGFCAGMQTSSGINQLIGKPTPTIEVAIGEANANVDWVTVSAF